MIKKTTLCYLIQRKILKWSLPSELSEEDFVLYRPCTMPLVYSDNRGVQIMQLCINYSFY